MSESTQRWISYNALTELAATDALERDQDGAFPERAFGGLHRLGLTGKPPLQTDEIVAFYACWRRSGAAILASVGSTKATSTRSC
jgi:hypothetical protein